MLYFSLYSGGRWFVGFLARFVFFFLASFPCVCFLFISFALTNRFLNTVEL